MTLLNVEVTRANLKGKQDEETDKKTRKENIAGEENGWRASASKGNSGKEKDREGERKGQKNVLDSQKTEVHHKFLQQRHQQQRPL